ncbi:MAG: hypothetical protein WA303_12860 [Bradyrhizobium sp.]|jgi:hypothetical protein
MKKASAWGGEVEQVGRKHGALISGALLLSALALGGCASSIADLPIVGTPAGAPARQNDAGTYLPVEDLPPNRDQAAIAPSEQAKIKAELLAARDRQASTAAAQDSAAK